MGHVSWGEAPSDIPGLYWGSGEVNLLLRSVIIRPVNAPIPSPHSFSHSLRPETLGPPLTFYKGPTISHPYITHSAVSVPQEAYWKTLVWKVIVCHHWILCYYLHTLLSVLSLWHASRGAIYLYIPPPILSLLILLQSSYILSRFINRALCEIDNASFAIDCVSF